MYDVTALGEVLIDFTQNGKSSQGNALFEANPGGAPCNVLAMLAKLGLKTAFIGKTGNDEFGRILGDAIKSAGIDTSGLVKDEMVRTTLAFIHNKEDGDREFSFYRAPGADLMLTKEEVKWKLIEESRIFHFGSLSLTSDPAKTATYEAVKYAKEYGKWISFDPNLRIPLWNELEEAREQIWYGIRQCDILKIADNEIVWLTGEHDFDKGVAKIKTMSDVKMVNVTLGRDGSISYYGDKKVYAEAFLDENTVDTTGAGDTFCACVLASVLENGLSEWTEKQMKDMLVRANRAASIVTTRKGALKAMPDKKELL